MSRELHPNLLREVINTWQITNVPRKFCFIVLRVFSSNMFSVSVGIDFGQPWRRTFGDNIVYTDWQKDNYYYAVQQQVCIRVRIRDYMRDKE